MFGGGGGGGGGQVLNVSGNSLRIKATRALSVNLYVVCMIYNTVLFEGVVTKYGDGGLQNGGEGVKFYPYKKGDRKSSAVVLTRELEVSSILKGAQKVSII